MNNYPISTLIQSIFNASSLSRSEFVKLLGYKNINKGIKNFNSWVSLGQGTDDFIQKLIVNYPEQSFAINQALNDSISIKKEELQKQQTITFKPFIKAETLNTTPSQITFYALAGIDKLRKIEFLNNELEDKTFITNFIKNHYQQNEGTLPFLGDILSYSVVLSKSEIYSYSVTGELLEELSVAPSNSYSGVSLR